MRTLWRLLTLLIFRLLLTSSWSTPNTAVTGAPISASDYNTYQRDNLTYLFSQRPRSAIFREGVANYTTSSTSFTAVDSTNLRLTMTVASGRIRVEATFTVRHSDTSSGSGSDLGGTISFDFLLNGTYRCGSTNGVHRIQQGNNGTQQRTVSIVGEFTTNVVNGSNTIDLVWLTSGATATMFNSGYPITMRGNEF